MVEGRIGAACSRAGRPRDSITLIAVTKTIGVETARALVSLGVTDLAENRPQELWLKSAAIPEVRWHMIGHLQRNKIERTRPIVRLIHSVDSVRLLQALEALGPTNVLLEINASGEDAKQGFAPDAIPIAEIQNLKNVRVHGLMTLAAYTDDPETARPTFALLRNLRDRLRESLDERHPLTELSMGMSGDFEVAIEEGATLIRLGTVLFEGLQ